jgi:hypothetical protein
VRVLENLKKLQGHDERIKNVELSYNTEHEKLEKHQKLIDELEMNKNTKEDHMELKYELKEELSIQEDNIARTIDRLLGNENFI